MFDFVTTGAVTRFLSENPPISLATGMILALLVVASVIRMLRHDIRSAALDKVTGETIKDLREDVKSLRERLDKSEDLRDELRNKMTAMELQFGDRMSAMSASIEVLRAENVELNRVKVRLEAELRAAKDEILTFELRVSQQMITIEDMAVKLRRLEHGQAGDAKKIEKIEKDRERDNIRRRVGDTGGSP